MDSVNDLLLGLDIDPLTASALAGLVWPVVQAAMDRVEWTPTRRRLVALAAAVVLGVVIWWAGAYPLSWRLVVAQAAVVAGVMQSSFTILKAIGLVDWVGRATPGGEPYAPRHASDRQA